MDLKPLVVPKRIARGLLGVGPTKFWEIEKAGLVEKVDVAGIEMILYSSLEHLIEAGRGPAAPIVESTAT